MWPWEHLAVGYVVYSLASRWLTGDSPRAAAAIAVAVGTQFPDLVDKPLAWSLDVVQSGVSVAHSAFVATALSIGAVLAARHFDRPWVGVAFAVGYLSHIPADVVYPIALGRGANVDAFFWPLGDPAPATRSGFLANFAYYLEEFLEFLATPRGLTFLALEITLVGLTTLLWISDGCPGLPRLGRALGTR